MKKRKLVAKPRKIARLRASSVERERPSSGVGPEWSRYFRPIKKPITLRIDADVLAWFQKQGRGYQTRINRALRKVMTEEMRKSGT
ncbi:MAG: BrnA antitoxin family protein [Terriglobales bacterium]